MRREGYPLTVLQESVAMAGHHRTPGMGKGDLTVVARRGRLGDGGTSLVGAPHGEEGRPGSQRRPPAGPDEADPHGSTTNLWRSRRQRARAAGWAPEEAEWRAPGHRRRRHG
jgi:hypothetical protein